MKAFYFISYAGPDAERYGELPDPIPAKNQILVEVKAASINPVDYKIKNGDAKIITGSKFPKIVGSDFAGIVRENQTETTRFKPGDRVYGAVSIITRKSGSMCGLLAVDAEKVRHIPAEMSFEEAASLPVAALTALNGLRRCSVKTGTNVLINGATGGVGHFAVQIAKANGAFVTATCSSGNAELALKLGADEVSGYKKEDLAGFSNKFDVIFDSYGKMEYADICRLLKRKGTYASTLFFPTSYFSAVLVKLVFNKKLTSSNMRSRQEDYEEIEKLFIEKKLRPVIENIFTLDKSAEAFKLAEHGKPRGKIVIKI